MMLPFLNAQEISPRFRGLASIAFAFLITPFVLDITKNTLSPETNFISIFLLLGQELIVGIFIGLVARVLMMTIEFTGNMIGAHIGLSSASVLNPNFQGTTVTSLIMVLFGTAMFLSLNLHHLVLIGLLNSYHFIPFNTLQHIQDMSKGYTELFSKTFAMGFHLALPFVVTFIISQVAYGLMNRIIPQMQVFFIALPLQLWGGIIIFSLLAIELLSDFSRFFEDEFRTLLKINNIRI